MCRGHGRLPEVISEAVGDVHGTVARSHRYPVPQAILAPVLLRRTKTSKLSDGQPIVALPPREQELVQQDFTPVRKGVKTPCIRSTVGDIQSYFCLLLPMLLAPSSG